MNNKSSRICSQELIHIYARANEDLYTRLTILYREAKHIQMNIAYLTNNSILFNKLKEEINDGEPALSQNMWDLGSNVDPDSLAWVIRSLAASVQNIKKDIWDCLQLIKKDMDPWVYRNLKANEPILLSDLRSFILSQGVLRMKAGQFAKQLGKFQDRIGQTIEHLLLPGSMLPSVRRRKEKGLSDKYLSTLCRWVYRDLALLTHAGMSCRYPYKEMPVVLQYWEHDYTSVHANVMYQDAYKKKWRKNIFNPDFPPLRSAPDANEKLLPSHDQLVVLQIGYWMLERHVLHPILGHELAHRILFDSLGNLHPLVLNADKKQDALRYLARGIIGIIDHWTPDLSSTRMVQDILCDMFGAARFGYAYVYAWFLEMFAYPMSLTPFGQGTSGLSGLYADEFMVIDWDLDEIKMKCRIAWPIKPKDRFPEDYLRGRCVMAWIAAMDLTHGTDKMADQLCQAVGLHLEMMLEARYESDPDRMILWQRVGNDLSELIRGKSLVAASLSGHFLKNMLAENEEELNSSDGWVIWKQRISPALHNRISHLLAKWYREAKNNKEISNNTNKLCRHTLPDAYSSEIIKSFENGICKLFGASDLSWRIEWMERDCSFLMTHATEDYLSNVFPPIQLLRNLIPDVDTKISKPSDQKSSRIQYPCLQLDGKQLQQDWKELCNMMVQKNGKNVNNLPYWDQSSTITDQPTHDLNGIFLNSNQTILDWIIPVSGSYDNYLMDLMVFSPVKHQELMLGECGSPYGNDSDNLLFSKALLGRYDQVVVRKYHGLHNVDNGDFSLQNDTLKIHLPAQGSPLHYEKLPSFDRRRLLREISIGRKSPLKDAKIILLVGLKYSGWRLIFLNWLKQNIYDKTQDMLPWEKALQNSLIRLYRSSGWEDFVFFLDPTYIDENVELAFNISEELAKHVLVKRTYTIFTSDILDILHQPVNKEKFSGGFNVLSHGNMSQCINKVNDIVEKVNASPCNLFISPGEMDLTIYPPSSISFSWAQFTEFRNQLMSNTQGIARVETFIQKKVANTNKNTE